MTVTKQDQGETPGALAWRRLRKNRGAVISLGVLVVMVLMAIAAPIITPFDPTVNILEYSVKPTGFRGNVLLKRNPAEPERPSVVAISSYAVKGDSVHYTDPAGMHYRIHTSQLVGSGPDEWHEEPLFLLGTDRFGRDMFSRLVYGMRVSLSVGLIAESIALAIGIFLGALAGYYRGWVDDGIMYVGNVVWSFPTIILVMAFTLILGQGFWQTFVAIGLTAWVDITRIVRGQFFSIREQEYVEATRALGYGSWRVIWRHMLPNAAGPIIVMGTAGFASAIIFEASLSFIGLGVQPPMASWGQMIRDGYAFLTLGTNWGMTVYPCLAMAIAVIAVNLLGDGLRDALDPKTTQR